MSPFVPIVNLPETARAALEVDPHIGVDEIAFADRRHDVLPRPLPEAFNARSGYRNFKRGNDAFQEQILSRSGLGGFGSRPEPA